MVIARYAAQRIGFKTSVHFITKCVFVLTGIRTPALYYVDSGANAIYMEYLNNCKTLKLYIDEILRSGDDDAANRIATEIGKLVACLHNSNIIHGDLTTSNVLVKSRTTIDYDLVLIDFGLTVIESGHNPEDKGQVLTRKICL